MESSSKSSLYDQLNGINYTEAQLSQFQDHFSQNGARNLGWYTQVIGQIRDVANGMIIYELSYPYDMEVDENDRLAFVEQLFQDPFAPDFWDISYVHLVEYKTTGPGGYADVRGFIMYDQLEEELKPGEELSFNRYFYKDQIFNTRDIYEILYETDIKYP